MEIPFTEIYKSIEQLPNYGTLFITAENYVYLKIHDDYIHRTFPILNNLYPLLSIPNYFNEDMPIGAHISIAYPNEIPNIQFNLDMNRKIEFSVGDFFIKPIINKVYCGLLVESTSLDQLRVQNKLPKLLNFKNTNIGFHITIATCNIHQFDNCIQKLSVL